MDVNPYESPREPGGQKTSEPDQPVPYPHWLIVIDIAMVMVVLAVIIALFLPAVQ
jgi:hypothetical protein